MTEEALFDLASNTPDAWRAESFDRGITDFCDASKLTPRRRLERVAGAWLRVEVGN